MIRLNGVILGAVTAAALLFGGGRPEGTSQTAFAFRDAAGKTPSSFSRSPGRSQAGGVDTSPRSRAGASSSSINVMYNGFPADAQAAFQHAVEIWESVLDAPVPITVNAYWTPMFVFTPAEARVCQMKRDFPNAPMSNTWYPLALANQLAGTRLDPFCDFEVNVNSSLTERWYLGTDGQPGGKLDLATVVLHEMAHGLGFVTSFATDAQTPQQGYWGYGFPVLKPDGPVIFDTYVVNTQNQRLIDTATFANPSVALNSQLQSGAIYFGGANATAAHGGKQPKIWAPSTFTSGSSITHLDETDFPAGNQNALMSPKITNGEAYPDPGPVTLGILRDLGWKTVSLPPTGHAIRTANVLLRFPVK